MSDSTEKVEKAIDLIEQARELMNDVVSGPLADYRICSEYYAYGEFGIRQAGGGKGNPNDGKLQDIIDKLEEEGL